MEAISSWVANIQLQNRLSTPQNFLRFLVNWPTNIVTDFGEFLAFINHEFTISKFSLVFRKRQISGVSWRKEKGGMRKDVNERRLIDSAFVLNAEAHSILWFFSRFVRWTRKQNHDRYFDEFCYLLNRSQNKETIFVLNCFKSWTDFVV
jgi:hypothetical protein